jgi:crotonobetainyl-CoA:carnitine CoA-transferase CaiB-like acyl-CoA transferase
MDTLLPPLRVLDLSDEKGFLCGKLLGDLGADVVKVEPPGGDRARRFSPFYDDTVNPERSLYWMALNNSKRGITLDLEHERGRELFLALVERCDIVVETYQPGYLDGLGLGYAALEKVNPRLILASLTPFGQSGPYRHYKTSDLVALALGGVMYITGDPERPPLRLFLDQAYFLSSAWAATGAVLAYYHREVTGVGQQVDISVHECMARLNYRPPIYWEFQKTVARRLGNLMTRGVNVTVPMLWRCRDGFVSWVFYAGIPGARENQALAGWLMGEGLGAELQGVNWEELNFATLSQQELDRFMAPVGELFSRHTRQELWLEGTSRGIRISKVCDIADLAANPQLQARSYWVPVEHEELGATLHYPGHPFLTTLTENRVRRRAPRVGEHNAEVLGEIGVSPEELARLHAEGVV